MGAGKSRNRLVALDGLRGIAALCVLFAHVRIAFGPEWLPCGWLAVDLFFVLSGFVIGRTYDLRLRNGWSPLAYFKVRLIRIYPMLLLGILLGLVAYVLGGPNHVVNPALALFMGLGMIPDLRIRVGAIFLLNPVQWSLFFELAANVVHGIAPRLFNKRGLAIAIGAGFLGLGAVAIVWGPLWVGPERRKFAGGFARVGFSFFAGLALSRLQRSTEPTLSPWFCAPVFLALLVLLCRPSMDASVEPWAGFAAITVGFPLIVAVAARTKTPAFLTKPLTFLGDISYALYSIHFPLLLFLKALLPADLKGAPFEGVLLLACGGIIVLAWAADRWIDRPVRKLLTDTTCGSPAR